MPFVGGDPCLQQPLRFRLCLGPLPPEGVARVSARVPRSLPVPWNAALQALVGDSLSNLCVIPLR